MRREFRSPEHKLVAFFQASRDRWRQRAQQYQKKIRSMEIRLRDVEASREHWRGKYFAGRRLSSEDPGTEPAPNPELPHPGGVCTARGAPGERGR